MAALVGERAAIGEDAARELDAERRQEARDRVQAAVVLADAPARYAAKQANRVRMARVLENGLHRSLLHEASGVEHADPVAHLRDHAEVVTDEQHRRVQLLLQLRHEIEYLRLDGRVEPGRRLVEDQQRRILCQGHRDHDPLLHSARELVWIAAQYARRIGDLHCLQNLERSVGGLLPRYAEDGERFHDLRADLQRRVQRGPGLW